MCPHSVRVPLAVKVDGLEVQVVLPSGPLAGEITGTKDLLVKPRK
ncbi:hypothetical protein FTUN_7601 [Frigoriglobus tundricola]|uniref:Uncharacterized protein n=1 Tax=Frigoriglobus tundricola TaxID=2774151 RepID=A0A6M5Z1D4_9BACT|nr:hypothetical protein FTUN_7601 [Frigoriglobus tundricola]